MDIADVKNVIGRFAGNTPWFNFYCDKPELAFNDLRVYSFRGKEALSEPFEFKIELVSPHSNINFGDYLTKSAVLTIADSSGLERFVHGIVREFTQLHTGNTFTHYRATIVPKLWFLSQTCNQQIYQHMTVPEIIEAVLRKYMFPAESYKFLLKDEYPQREYCTQYGESDLHLISRVCEEESIFFYFEHSKDGHTLCFSDRPPHTAIPGESAVRFHPGSGTVADMPSILRWNSSRRVNSDITELREWNFTRPNLNLTARLKETDVEKAPVPDNMLLETYLFPHLYQWQKEGGKYADLQLQRQTVFSRWAEAVSNVSRFLPGHTMSVHGLPRIEDNRGWGVVSVEHAGEQPTVLEHEAPQDRGLDYKSQILLLPDDLRFIPELRHKKVRIEGLQSAIVTGPGGEEVFTDEYGRVRVKFHWDRTGGRDQNTTCWVRVADTWAGQNFGAISIPRIGQEVLVEFMEGDPDRPVITGRVYNAANMPPWELPAQKTLSGVQSREFNGSGRNQLVMDDTTGQIQTQLSSDHQLSQLNLGHITRIDHIKGRKETRGEGFELRTDGWGVARAGKGMFITTYLRTKARNHQTDLSETAELLQNAAEQHKKTADLAARHNAQAPDVTVPEELRGQVGLIKGTGDNDEIKNPQLIISSPSGLALATEGPAHTHSDGDHAVTTRKNMSISTALDFLVSALNKVSLFAHKGMKLFTGRGKMEIQAQSGPVEITAKDDVIVACENGKVRLSSPTEIILSAGGSYIKINSSGIEQGTKGKWLVFSGSRAMAGPKDMSPLKPELPAADLELGDKPDLLRVVLAAAPGHPPLAGERYVVTSQGKQVADGYTTKDGEIIFEHNPEYTEYDIRTVNGTHGFRIEMVEEFSQGDEGLKERLAAEGHPAVMDACDTRAEGFGLRLWQAMREDSDEGDDANV